MKLSVFERLVLLHTLPKEGNYVTLKIIRQLREALSFDEAEIEKLELKIDPEKGNASWNKAKDEGKEVEIGREARRIIRETFEKLDKNNKLTLDHYELYEKFINEV